MRERLRDNKLPVMLEIKRRTINIDTMDIFQKEKKIMYCQHIIPNKPENRFNDLKSI